MPEETGKFKSFIEQHKEKVYSRICDFLPQGEPKFFNEKVMRVYVDRKGQYRRPAYVMLWNLLYGGTPNDAILPAAVQQVSEDWILMHDDILDGNQVRRKLPAAHVLYGENYAMLGGDALQTVMWRMVNEAVTALGSSGQAYFDKVYDIMIKTSIGQYMDVRLTEETKDITKFTKEEYYESIHAKAAYYSVYGPMQCGAIIAGAKPEIIERIPEYGIAAGKAFQIKDDILDCTSTQEKLGKSIGNDVLEGAKTLILWHAVSNAEPKTLKKLRGIYSKARKDKTSDDVMFVLNAFNDLGSIEYAQSEATKLADTASIKFDKLTKNIPESAIKETAREAIGYVAVRSV